MRQLSPRRTFGPNKERFVIPLFCLFSCASAPSEAPLDGDPAKAWALAKGLWEERDITAFDAWRRVSPTSVEGRRDRALLEEGDHHYRKGLRLFEEGKTVAAGEAFQKGAAVAPMDPERYFELAEIYRKSEMMESASKYYLKYSRARPDSPRAKQARQRVKEVDPVLGNLFDPPTDAPHKPSDDTVAVNIVVLVSGMILGVVAVLALFSFLWPRYGRGASLSKLIDQSPELHSAIAYLIGSLRHELLKHRIGVVGDVITGLRSQKATGPQQLFLSKRLFSGVPVYDAWRAHLTAFSRTLGPRLNLHRDRPFREAGQAIRTIARLEPEIERRGTGALAALRKAHQRLKRFDRYLAAAQSRLVRTRVDETLLRQIADEVGGEYAVSGIALDDLIIETIRKPVFIEVPRVDLLVILKNLLRNAIFAVAEEQEDRRVEMAVSVDVEPTGEEAVRIRVLDTGRETIDPGTLGEHPGSGLGLVLTAVKRYGGALEIRQRKDEYRKEVTTRFFRAFDDGGENT